MKKFVSLILTAAAAAGILTSCTDTKTVKLTPETDAPYIDEDVEKLTLYTEGIPFEGQLAAGIGAMTDGKENTVYSPISIFFVLSMLRDGAVGETKAELDKLLAVDESTDLKEYSRNTLSHLLTLENTALNITNSVWIDDGFEPKESYLDSLAKGYFAEMYITDLPSAENQLNAYIKEKTKGLINKLLDDTALDESVLALVNTVYLDAEWQSQFKADRTNKREFFASDESVNKIDFMYNAERTEAVIENDDLIGVALPYSDGALSFVAVMPKDKSVSAGELTKEILTNSSYSKLIEEAYSERIKLYLPKFEIEYSPNLDEILRSLGLNTAYSNAADFSLIAEDLLLNSIKTKAVIRVDEKGTEAAAVTVGMVGCTSAAPMENPRIIEFNRPFSWAVVDTVTGAVLFVGEFNRG